MAGWNKLAYTGFLGHIYHVSCSTLRILPANASCLFTGFYGFYIVS